MAESTLSLTYNDLRAEVGHKLGYGRDYDAWDAEQAASVASAIKSGLRQFYVPPPLGGRASHRWTFLRPTRTVTTVDGTADYDLPDDYGGMDGDLTVLSSDNAYAPVRWTGEGQVRALRSTSPDATGRPAFAADRPRAMQGGTGQRFTLLLYPTPDDEYTVQYRYFVLPDALSDERLFPYGGMAHAETILASCLAMAEERLDDVQGTYKAAFLERLAASVAHDSAAHEPDFYGKNLDRSDDGGGHGTRRYRPVNNVTYNGVQY